MVPRFVLVVVALTACSPAEPAPVANTDVGVDIGDDAIVPDTTSADSADSGDTADRCCPISPVGCCMDLGGARTASGCPRICDMIATDLVTRIDDAGCPYWFDPPGGTTACNPGGPPDTGVADSADAG